MVELSWYGDGDMTAPLGEAFHSRRLRLISSQVGKVAPSHRPRWSHGRRLAAALALLARSRARRPARAAGFLRRAAGAAAGNFRARQRRGLPADPLSASRDYARKGTRCTRLKSRDQIMIAHSFRGEVFGPAQKLHGATFVVGVAFLADSLDAHGIVVDIARAHEVLKAGAGSTQLPQSRRAAAVRGHQHHHRIPDPAPVRSARRRRPCRQARPRRPASSQAIRVTVAELPAGARLVRGAVVVKACRVRGARRSCDPDRRLCL